MIEESKADRPKTSKFSCGKARSKVNEDESGSIAFFTNKVPAKKSGMLEVEVGDKKKKMYFFLKDNLLYSYTGDEEYPSYMIFMLGSFVNTIKCGNYRSFEICHEHRPTIILSATHTEDRN